MASKPRNVTSWRPANPSPTNINPPTLEGPVVTSYALVVPLEAAEAARQFVASLGIGRRDLKLGRQATRLLIPIHEPIEPPLDGATVEVAEFEPNRPPRSYKDLAKVPDTVRPLLPTSFDIIGDLVLIKIPPSLVPHGPAIGQAILEAHPNLRGVFRDEGVTGPHRVRTLRPLAGEARTRTVHAEYGARFHVDLATAYFTPRLANEHHRVAEAVQPGETFVDATSGVGPFAILAARRRVARRIVAIDLNPTAVALLRENLLLNRLQERVEVVPGDASAELARLKPVDRIVINLPLHGERLLRSAWSNLRSGGTIHYYTVARESEASRIGPRICRQMGDAEERPGETLSVHAVHPYSPEDSLLAIDFSVL